MPKQNIMTILLLLLLIGSCKENGTGPIPPVDNEPKWEEVEIFRDADIRYIIKNNETIFVSAVYNNSQEYFSVLYSTKNGNNWDTLKTFSRDIGPITFNKDTLLIVETGRIWEYHPSFNWRIKYEMLIGAWLTRDIYLLNEDLFVFENRYMEVTKDSIIQINSPVIVSKFVKQKVNDKEVAYTIPYYVYHGYPFRFDGVNFSMLNQGISNNEHTQPNYPAIAIYRDTLYAGFNTPSIIKRYCNQKWENVFDTLNIQNSVNELGYNTVISAILFKEDDLFIGTNNNGVFLWRGNNWEPISNGLKKQSIIDNQQAYTPIIFLEYLDGIIFTAYGEPAFAPIHRGRGLFKYKLN